MPHIWVKMGSQQPQPMDGRKASGLKTSTLSFSTIFFSDSHTAEPFLRKQKTHCPQAVTSGSQGCPPGTHQHHQKKIPSVTPHKAFRDPRYGGDQTDPALEWFSLTRGDGADIYETWKRLPAADQKQAWCKLCLGGEGRTRQALPLISTLSNLQSCTGLRCPLLLH